MSLNFTAKLRPLTFCTTQLVICDLLETLPPVIQPCNSSIHTLLRTPTYIHVYHFRTELGLSSYQNRILCQVRFVRFQVPISFQKKDLLSSPSSVSPLGSFLKWEATSCYFQKIQVINDHDFVLKQLKPMVDLSEILHHLGWLKPYK